MSLQTGINKSYNVTGLEKNTVLESHRRTSGIMLYIPNVRIQANNETVNKNVFKLIGQIKVSNQYAIIKSVTALTNMTAVYADVWDGSTSTLLTKNTADFSNLPAGSIFAKAEDDSQEYVVMDATTSGAYEPASTRRLGQPFFVWQKTGGVDTFIRFNYTTNTILDFTMDLYFEYLPLDGGCLEIA